MLTFTPQYSMVIREKGFITALRNMTKVTRSFRLVDKPPQDITQWVRKNGKTEKQLVSSWLTWRVFHDPWVDSRPKAAHLTFKDMVLRGHRLRIEFRRN
jgi:hypothetical protein